MSAVSDLAIDTLRDPKQVARQIISWQLDRATLYMALLAVAAVNTLLASAPVVLLEGEIDPAARSAVPILGLLERPLALFAMIAGGLLVMVHGLVWAGRALGGQGDFADMLALLTWLQALRAAAQALVLVLSLIVPAIAGLVALIVAIVAFWLLLHFISAALRFDSLFRAFGLLLVVLAGLFIGMMMLVTLTGVTAGGL
ncbi:YIP1 family protein [Tateyamaria omphalii]|uniref:YIP1 family protein n=1 Tax=Tateyamaria omphalii TaxID=299262 RepID=UPI001C9A0757|nr:YIP1 family protein [Tateyamaria omphalii]MBY5932505.1 YIP1 family protein [Tateyamaria omphalii]